MELLFGWIYYILAYLREKCKGDGRGEIYFAKVLTTSPVCLARRAVPALCSFFVIRQRTNQENGPKGLMPFGFPQCAFAGARSAQHGAKVNGFRFCVGVLKKNTDTGVARTLLSQTMIAPASFPVIDEVSNRTGKQRGHPIRCLWGVHLPAYEEFCKQNSSHRI